MGPKTKLRKTPDRLFIFLPDFITQTHFIHLVRRSLYFKEKGNLFKINSCEIESKHFQISIDTR